MTKESKTMSTIRRRKGKQVAIALQKIREENPKPVVASEAEIAAAEVEDHCYMFDDKVLGPIVLRRLMSNSRSLFLALIVIRCANALLIQTQFVPDEYWQSLEVAHKMVFGYGYMTWEWREGLRGYSYPLVFATLYKILYFLGIDSRVMLIKAPRLVQAVIAAYGDLHLYKLSSRLSGRATAQWSLLCQLLSWFTIYCCTRTLSNSTETALIVGALSYFPWPDSASKRNDVYKFLILAALSVIVRPTAALIWILLCSWHLQRLYGSMAFQSVFNAYVFVGGLSFGGSVVVDRIWYGHWTVVHFNFLWFNVVQGGASIYGTHPWHWYFLQGVPVVMGTLVIPFFLGAWRAKNKVLLWIILWILATHSFLPHKEFRFILPAVPLAMHYCGVYFQHLCSKPPLRKFKTPKSMESETVANTSSDAEKEDFAASASESPPSEMEGKEKQNSETDDKEKTVTLEKKDTGKENIEETKSGVKDAGLNLSSESAPKEVSDTDGTGEVKSSPKSLEKEEGPGSNESLTAAKEGILKEENERKDRVETMSPSMLRDHVHRHNLLKAKVLIGLLAVTNLLPALYFSLIHQRGTVMVSKFLHQAAINNPGMEVLFLMPCHSTPYYSHLHQNISMRFLTCEPNLQGLSGYEEEADRFYQSPQDWLRSEYGRGKRYWPTHIVYFNSLHKQISSLLTQSGYRMCESFFHTHFPEGRVGSSIFISCRWSVKSM
ncbi:GPI mannosyltransferase 3 [Aplysia californica]|uniref:Mannosyltransferase n=1 Tax=Aplysia californica TaxID=6500 RepID=A0ABM1AG61_APLCA|nr:GPI mannosyltransferase 3 [Aplysia californica]